MTTTYEDREKAREFCDRIGCTKVHHLREELPDLIAQVREAERARCLEIVRSEEELVGQPPLEVQKLFAVVDKIGIARMTVGSTKKSIARRIEEEPKS